MVAGRRFSKPIVRFLWRRAVKCNDALLLANENSSRPARFHSFPLSSAFPQFCGIEGLPERHSGVYPALRRGRGLARGERQRNRPEVAIVIHKILCLVPQFSISGIDLLRAGV